MPLEVVSCGILGSYGKNHFLNPILCQTMYQVLHVHYLISLSHLTDGELDS